MFAPGLRRTDLFAKLQRKFLYPCVLPRQNMPNLANVVFALPLQQAFTYRVPDALAGLIRVGSRVLVPLGPRRLTGFVVALPATCEHKRLRSVEELLDIEPVVSGEILALAEWISDYYLCSLGEALRAAVPSVFFQTSKQVVSLRTERPEHYATLLKKSAPRQSEILRFLGKEGKVSVAKLSRQLGAKNLMSSLTCLQEKELIEIAHDLAANAARPRVETFVELVRAQGDDFAAELQQLRERAPRQAEGLAFLQARGAMVPRGEMLRATGLSPGILKALADKRLVKFSRQPVFRDYYQSVPIEPPSHLQLTSEQQAALSEILTALDARSFQTFLLFGVTGSGKTQVYIEAISRTLQQGRDAIVLVPEIALTPQAVQRFRSHFRDQVAVLHSAMSEGERYDSWRKIKRGAARVVIGPRSAIFAPLARLGLVVVDEEHEASYKQTDSNPRYHARDLSVVRARACGATVLLGSATPSSESFYNATTGKYVLLELTNRVNDLPMPPVEIVDMQKERRLSGSRKEPVFSRLLAHKIEEKIALKEQVILLLNRRGFSSYIKCRECGFVEECENCSISLTYHSRGRWLRCHYCDFSKPAPDVCPSCGADDIVYKGLGTQQVEEQIAERFPQARLVRMDLDTTSKKWSHDRILTDFGAGKYDILLGTQMVAKGLDFGRVTLVGVVNADIGMLLPDFRSSERTFQLITQVAGRAGRNELGGEVIIQTFSPESVCLLRAQTHDFRGYYSGEIRDRERLGYPPFARLACLRFRGEELEEVRRAARKFAGILKQIPSAVRVLGPSPAPIERLQNNYRYQILLKVSKAVGASSRVLRQSVRAAMATYLKQSPSPRVHVTIDIDPASMM